MQKYFEFSKNMSVVHKTSQQYNCQQIAGK